MTRTILVMSIGLIAGCTRLQPYNRDDVWYPTGSNAGNMAAMAVRPSDLIHGRNGDEGDAHQAVLGINRVWGGQAKMLGTAPSTPGAGAAPASGGQN